MAEKMPKMLWFRFARFLCWVFSRLFFRVSVSGTENVPEEGALLIICNHQSFLDPIFCGTPIKRPLFFLARDTLFKNPVLGRLFASVNAIPVRRGEADISTMKMVIKKLKQGHGVCLFPEATRSSDGKITAFKPGFGLLCRRGKAAVVPMVVEGAFECWPRHKKLFTVGAKITVRYGECISAERVSQMNDRELAEDLTGTIRLMQNEIREKQGKKPFIY
ncbi:MAG: lysophospholipid acyltransferase family protein [Planctomycetota bacterium]|jgi:1-acyl-sn-glycerol-3-phosphate acyltransferase